MGEVNLQTLIEESEADKGIVFDSNGQVVDSYNISKENNVAAMASVIVTMAHEFFQDALESESLNQLVLTSNEGLVVINKYDNNHIVCLLADDVSKVAMIKLTLKSVTLQ
ncbi:roadblock/LC7 domain-containing protein [Tenacibaculum sp. FZY0031]|uniref:roadblock/LC7 domain-containing protein n=1 Tax=unclassified Tenacibaculum TaxID=2635139 RepID=UPI002ECC2CE1|nr:roadblock/LC7 domain-containing protein [Tenacibaculum sp. FZY0031]